VRSVSWSESSVNYNNDKRKKTKHANRAGIKTRGPRVPGSIPSTMRVQLFAFVVLAAKTAAQADGLFLDVLSYLYRCRARDLGECVERDLTRTIDGLMDKNETYRLNRYLTVSVVAQHDGGIVRSDDLPARVADLFNALRVQYRPEVIGDDFESTSTTRYYVFESRVRPSRAERDNCVSNETPRLRRPCSHVILYLYVARPSRSLSWAFASLRLTHAKRDRRQPREKRDVNGERRRFVRWTAVVLGVNKSWL